MNQQQQHLEGTAVYFLFYLFIFFFLGGGGGEVLVPNIRPIRTQTIV